MNKKIKSTLWSLPLALGLALPAAQANAQDMGSLYITPKVMYSYKTGDMSSTRWNGNGPFRASILSGDDKDGSFGLGLSVGTDLTYITDYPIRLELEYLYHGKGVFETGSHSFTTGTQTYVASQEFEVKAHSLMANAFYDFNFDSFITPYIGGGIGMAYLDTKYRTNMGRNGSSGSARLSDTSWNFAWNVGGGVAWHINENVALDIGYRYMDLGKSDAGSFNIYHLDYSGSPKVDYTAHEVSVGLRFSGF